MFDAAKEKLRIEGIDGKACSTAIPKREEWNRSWDARSRKWANHRYHIQSEQERKWPLCQTLLFQTFRRRPCHIPPHHCNSSSFSAPKSDPAAMKRQGLIARFRLELLAADITGKFLCAASNRVLFKPISCDKIPPSCRIRNTGKPPVPLSRGSIASPLSREGRS